MCKNSQNKSPEKKKRKKKAKTKDTDMEFLDELLSNQIEIKKKGDDLAWFNERFDYWLELQPKQKQIFGQ